MEEKKADRRVLKTKKAIRNAVVQLLTEKELDQINVTDIAQAADINRKTFYNYYSGVHQVVGEIEDELVAATDWAVKEVDIRRDIKNPYRIFKKLNQLFSSDLEFYSSLFQMRGNLSLVYKLTSLLKGKTKEALLRQFPQTEESADVLVDFMVTGMLAVYEAWFRSGRSQSLEKISNTLSVLCFSGLQGILEIEE